MHHQASCAFFIKPCARFRDFFSFAVLLKVPSCLPLFAKSSLSVIEPPDRLEPILALA
jgi:hypothetical protein